MDLEAATQRTCFNRAKLDRNNDGVTDSSDDACGDLPNVTLQKQFLNAVQIAKWYL